MKSSRQIFIRNLDELKAHLIFVESEKRLFGIAVSNEKASPVEAELFAVAKQLGAGISKKRFDYNSVIVALYGFFEQFVEGLLKGYLRGLTRTSSCYDDIPEVVRGNHVEVTAGMFKVFDLPKYRGIVTPENLTANLHSCFTNQPIFNLNIEAFAHHSANFRTGVVDQFFLKVGIKNISQRANQLQFLQEVSSKCDPSLIGFDPEKNTIFAVDDLAERRNEVAHGSESEILSNDILRDYILLLEAYGESLYEIVWSEALAFEVRLRGKELGETLIIHNHSIVCINVTIKNTSVKKGDVLVALLESGPLSAVGGEISSIGIDKQMIEAITCLESMNLAFEVDFRGKKKQSFKLLTR